MSNDSKGLKRLFIKPAQDSVSIDAPKEMKTFSEILPPPRSNVTMTPDIALSIGTVYRSAQIISTVCSDLPLEVRRNGQLIESPSVVTKPDRDRSYSSFIKRAVIDLALHGNAYFYQTKDGRGQTVNIQVLNPKTVTVRFNDAGKKFYDVTDGNETKTYTDDVIRHLRLLEVPGQTLGLGPIQAARAEVAQAKNTKDYASTWFVTGNGIPNGYLKTDQELVGEEAQVLIEGWNEFVKNNKTAVLSKGLSFETPSLSPEDLQFLQVQSFNKTEIATLFGVPLNYINAELNGTSSFTYSNLSQVNQVFYSTTLRAYLSEVEAAITECLPNRVEATFDLSRLLKTDDRARYESYEVALRAGILTVDEVRELEGREPLPEPPAPEPAPIPEPEPEPEPEA